LFFGLIEEALHLVSVWILLGHC